MAQPLEALVLYKRHTKSCSVHRSRVPIANRKFWWACFCPIWITGRTPDAIVPRQSTGFSDLKQAEAFRSSLLATTSSNSVQGTSIAECIEVYLASRCDELSEKTLAQHRLVLDRLRRFYEQQGVLFVRELNADSLETFRTHGLPAQLQSTSRATAMAKVHCFLRTAFRRSWIAEPLVDKLTRGKAVYQQKDPFTEEETTLILDEALKLTGGTHAYAKHPITFRLLLELMIETGMRVGDAIRYDPAKVTRGEYLWVYNYVHQKSRRTEQPKSIEAYLDDRLKTAIDKCHWLSASRPFAFGEFRNPNYLASEVYYRMQTIGQRTGVTDCRPHRLRDTFAVRLLLSGIPLEDVARLLGHSSVKVTETYYAKWIAARKKRLERLLAERRPAEALVNS